MLKVTLKRPMKNGRRCWLLRWEGGSRLIGSAEGPGAISRKSAEAERTQQMIQVNSGAVIGGAQATVESPEPVEVPSIGKVWARASEVLKAHRDGTRYAYRRAIERLEGWAAEVEVTEIGPMEVGSFVAALGATKKTNTVRSTVRNLKAVWTHARIEPNPWKGQKTGSIPKRKRYLDRGEVAKLLRWLRSLPGDRVLGPHKRTAAWWTCFLEVALGTGARLGELLNLRWDRVGIDGLEILETEASVFRLGGQEYPMVPWSGKTDGVRVSDEVRVYREVSLTQQTMDALTTWRDRSDRDASPYVFIDLERLAVVGKRIEAKRWRQNQNLLENLPDRFAVIQKLAGLAAPAATVHDLRFTHMGECQDLGFTIGETARRVGDDKKTVLAFYDQRRKGEGDTTRAKLEKGTFGAPAEKAAVKVA